MRLRKSSLLVLFLVSLLALAGVSAWLWLSHGEPDRPVARLDAESEQAVTTAATPDVGPVISADTLFNRQLAKCDSASRRIEVIEALPKESWAKSDLFALKNCMESDESAEVRSKAFEVAYTLSLKEDREAVTAVLRNAIRCTHADVQTKVLRQCRLQPNESVVDELLEAASKPGQERYLAVHALAQLKDPRAHAKVLEAAKDEQLPKAERARAIALLARSSLPEAIDYLKQVAASQDADLSWLATDTLEYIQSTAKK